MTENKTGYRINLYLRKQGPDAVLREAIERLPRGSARKLVVEAVRVLVPGVFDGKMTVDELVLHLAVICKGKFGEILGPEEADDVISLTHDE